jgi:hypothetical protein
MGWEVISVDGFQDWYAGLTTQQQNAILARVALLRERGPMLGRPTVDHIEASRHHNMKELRISKDGALRILFAFDPIRQAVLLVGGDKTGRWSEWYREAIPLADDLFDQYLKTLGEG